MSLASDMNREDRDKLIQILSELSAVRNDIAEIKAEQKSNRPDKTRLSLLESRVDQLEQRLNEFTKNIQEKYVTQDQFEPIRKVFWIVVGVVATAVVGGVASLIMISG